jgi:hypothetical protein
MNNSDTETQVYKLIATFAIMPVTFAAHAVGLWCFWLWFALPGWGQITGMQAGGLALLWGYLQPSKTDPEGKSALLMMGIRLFQIAVLLAFGFIVHLLGVGK